MMVEFDEVVEKITDAVRQVEADAGASPVLVAVVGEFEAKLEKARKHSTGGLPGHDPGPAVCARRSPGDLQARGWRLTAQRA